MSQTYYFRCGHFTDSVDERMEHLQNCRGCYSIDKRKWEKLVSEKEKAKK